MRAVFVSGRLAIAICVRPNFLTDFGKASQFARAAGTASSAAVNSSGSIPASGPSSSVQEPFALAA